MAAILFAIVAVAGPARAQSIPFADTEDATLSEIDVKDGGRNWHPVVTLDIRNGDYARGALDDDDAALDRVPVHVAFGGALVLRRGRDGSGDLFVIGQSSNGFHAPRADERVAPRAWYESNNLLGLAWRPADGLTTAATYTIKTSPNGVASTTHEASLSILYTADRGLGRLKPRAAITRRTQGEGGLYTIAGISPSFTLSGREEGPSLSVPVLVGVGWNGFYAEGSGTRVYGSGGLSMAYPIKLGGSAATLQADILALVRDDRLRRLDAPGGTTAAVVPHATISLMLAW
ncbi:hypothetical protein [Sphingomonas sp. Leaf257]|jgi:hypothetical protein|uniref:hypothetical protein n=1 Tax=Sphingomonas sp. Leaf257 TaxID=1736309 RepID=UPI0006F92341|nr:hypothetical protein [Sphingomonas sp. Leaf257]KQO52864.1 hypothetical protein ASF14_06210 [Sphingomonas sp. Leaf257]